MTTKPGLPLHASATDRASSALAVNGFSHRTCLPALSAAMVQ